MNSSGIPQEDNTIEKKLFSGIVRLPVNYQSASAE